MNNVLGIINLHEDEKLLKEITRHRPLAAVPFGGRFRLIDFVLSNMVNSGIHHVGIVAKSKYRALMDHLRSGKEWDLARKRNGLFMMPPPDHIHYSNSIYKGDLEHFHNHLDSIKKSQQHYVLIAGSHTICNLNYSDVFKFHVDNQADITIVYKQEESCPEKYFAMATVLKVDGENRVTDMEVKSDKAAGGNICMETFVIAKELLLQIIEDCVARGEFDFIKEGIIKNLHRYKIYGYRYDGYMAKINSIQAYYQANMSLLLPEVWTELFSKLGPIYTKVKDTPPANYREYARVQNSMIANGCIIDGTVENSILFRGVKVQKGAYIKNSIIMQKSEVGSGAMLENIICDKDVKITDGKRLVGDPNYVMVIEKGMVV
ncbi:MAG: glucose-phosphate adenylyltransferase, GlgD subunit [Firmicutes bacterium]|nr:glucose-phosphate adenylyltransferase, GlgD subunit [Bacillota bacterium]